MKKTDLQKMSTKELEQILAAIRQVLQERMAPHEQHTPQPQGTREVLDRRKGSKGGWLRTEMVKCGKASHSWLCISSRREAVRSNILAPSPLS